LASEDSLFDQSLKGSGIRERGLGDIISHVFATRPAPEVAKSMI